MISCGLQSIPKFLPYRSHTSKVKENIQVITYRNQFVQVEVLDAMCLGQSQAGSVIFFHHGHDLDTFVWLTEQFFKKS